MLDDMLPAEGAELSRTPETAFRAEVFPGLYAGIVEDVQDPEYRGRIRIRVAGVHEQDKSLVKTAHLPWALPCAPDAGGDGYGEFNVPYNHGDQIWVMFIAGRSDQPVWMGSWWSMSPTGVADSATRPAPGSGAPVPPDEPKESKLYQDAKTPAVVRTDRSDRSKPNGAYPFRSAKRTRAGHLIEISDEPEHLELRVTDAKGNTVWIDTTNSEIKIYVKGNAYTHVDGDHYTRVTGDMTTQVDGKWRVKCGGDAQTQAGGNNYVDGANVHLNLTGPTVPDVPAPATGPLDSPDP